MVKMDKLELVLMGMILLYLVQEFQLLLVLEEVLLLMMFLQMHLTEVQVAEQVHKPQETE